MIEEVKKILNYQLREKVTEDNLCKEIGFSRQTFYNLRHGFTKPNQQTIDLVNNFITKEKL